MAATSCLFGDKLRANKASRRDSSPSRAERAALIKAEIAVLTEKTQRQLIELQVQFHRLVVK